MPVAWFGRTFQSLHIRDYRILWFGTIFMSAGFQMQILARGYLAFDLTGSNTALGGVMLGFGIPSLLLGLWGGVIVDRMRKRPLLIGAQLLIAVTSVAIATLITLDLIQYWHLVAAAVLQATSFSVVGPGRMAFTTSLVKREQLPNAIALQQFSNNGTRVIGPPIAGALIGIYFIGVAGVYYLTTIGFILGALSMVFLPPGHPQPRTEKTSVLADLTEGLAYVRRNRDIFLLITTMFVVMGLGFAYMTFLPSITKDVFDKGAGGLGILSGATAVGAIVASLGVAAIASHPKAWLVQIGFGIAFGVSLIALGVAPIFAVALLIGVLIGAAQSGFQTLNNALVMTVTEERFQGRVMSLVMMAFSVFAFTSYPLGILADGIGVRSMLVIQGVVLVALVVLVNAAGLLGGVRMQRRAGTAGREEGAVSPAGGGG